jgi:hypothetical protein
VMSSEWVEVWVYAGVLVFRVSLGRVSEVWLRFWGEGDGPEEDVRFGRD